MQLEQSLPLEAFEETGQPLKVCLLSYRGKPTSGGQGVYIKRLARALADLGHKVEVISGQPYPVLDDDITLHKLPSLDLYNPDDLFRLPSLHELKDPINMLEWLLTSSGGFPEMLTFGMRAYNFIKAHPRRYDIIHDNQCLAYGLLKMQDLGIPVVATFHHPITKDRDMDVKAQKWPWQKFWRYRWYSFLSMQMKVTRRLEHVITVSEASKRDICKDFGAAEAKFHVAPNGINFNVFHPLSHIKRHPHRIMVTNSADTPLKGLRYLIEAVHEIRQQRPIELLVIGQPKQGGQIEQLVDKLNMSDTITFTGRIRDEEFAGYYAEATLAVVPSLYEGFGMPASEAMACRVPVISTTGGALPEVVGDAGILVPPADSTALRDAIIDLLDNPEKRKQLAEAGYERAHQIFTWHNHALTVDAVYREALNANS